MRTLSAVCNVFVVFGFPVLFFYTVSYGIIGYIYICCVIRKQNILIQLELHLFQDIDSTVYWMCISAPLALISIYLVQPLHVRAKGCGQDGEVALQPQVAAA